MLKARHLGWLVAFAFIAVAFAGTIPGTAQTAGIIQVKLGLGSMSKAERANLWKMVDEYATVDALQEFCGTKLNLQKRAWRAVAACVEVKSLRRVLAVFRKKKKEYLTAWETLHGDEEKRKLVCDRFGGKLREYARIMRGQIEEAANMCRNCFFC